MLANPRDPSGGRTDALVARFNQAIGRAIGAKFRLRRNYATSALALP